MEKASKVLLTIGKPIPPVEVKAKWQDKAEIMLADR
jgi:hypothetical protein